MVMRVEGRHLGFDVFESWRSCGYQLFVVCEEVGGSILKIEYHCDNGEAVPMFARDIGRMLETLP